MKTTFLNHKQYDALHGFFTHIWCSNFDDVDLDSEFYAKRLDSLGVPWAVQNTVARLGEVRNNAFLYFRNVLKKVHLEENP